MKRAVLSAMLLFGIVGCGGVPRSGGAAVGAAQYVLQPSDLPTQMTHQQSSLTLTDRLLSCRNVPFSQASVAPTAAFASFRNPGGQPILQIMSIAVLFGTVGDAQAYFRFVDQCITAIHLTRVPIPGTIGNQVTAGSSPQGGYPAVEIAWRQGPIVDLVVEAVSPPGPRIIDVYHLAQRQNSYAPH